VHAAQVAANAYWAELAKAHGFDPNARYDSDDTQCALIPQSTPHPKGD
jgi:hypothetical protein